MTPILCKSFHRPFGGLSPCSLVGTLAKGVSHSPIRIFPNSQKLSESPPPPASLHFPLTFHYHIHTHPFTHISLLLQASSMTTRLEWRISNSRHLRGHHCQLPGSILPVATAHLHLLRTWKASAAAFWDKIWQPMVGKGGLGDLVSRKIDDLGT